MKQQRQYGLDILRIISMLGIIGLHILENGEAILGGSSALTSGFLSGMFVLCSCSVNVFAMLTGYLYAKKSSVKSFNLLRLLTITFFYCALIAAAVRLWKPEWFTVSWLKALFPVLAGRYWYITSYVMVFVLIPYLNIMIQGMDRKTYRVLLILLVTFLSVFTTAVKPTDPFVVKEGYSPLWLVVCYLIGGYISVYMGEISRPRLWIGVFAANVAVLTALHFRLGFNAVCLLRYCSPFMVINACLLVLLFSKLRWNKGGKLILSLSGAAFGVYIIHSHILLYDAIIAGNFRFIGHNGLVQSVCAFFGALLGIYAGCWLLEVLRKALFKLTRLDKLLDHIGRWLDRLLNWNT